MPLDIHCVISLNVSCFGACQILVTMKIMCTEGHVHRTQTLHYDNYIYC